MPFPSPVSSPNKATMRASGYWNSPLVTLCQNTVIFACRADESLTDTPFVEFLYDTVTVGAFGDVMPGMVFYISSTNSIRAAKYRGRVRKDLTASIFYCDENATVLNTGDYIFVTRDVDLFAKIRRDAFMDYDVAYHAPEPQISGLPSVFALYDDDDDGVVSFSPTQSGVAVAQGASISSWLWTISGDGTTAYTTGTSTSQNPVIELEAGFEYLIRCRVTDSNAIPHFQFVRVFAVDFNFTSLVVAPIVAGEVSHNLSNGFTSSVTAYADVDTLIDRTFALIFTVQHFGDDTTTAIRSNIMMHGRLRSASITTSGSAEAGSLQEVTFPVEGIASYLQRLKIPNDIIRDISVPNEWGELNQPNPYRILCYMMDNYTTLTNLCSFTAGSAAFVGWRIGGEPVSADGGYALDVINSFLDRIKAALNFAPDGELFMEQGASYQVDRSAIQTINDFSEADGDYRDYALDLDSSKNTGQVVAFGGSFNSTNGTYILYTAQAPSIVYGDAPEVAEINREILTVNSSISAATTELAARTGNHLAYINPKPMLTVLLKGGFSLLMVATNYQRWTHTIPANSNIMGKAYTAEDFWQLQQVTIIINRDGSLDTTGEFIGETLFTDAQSIASLLPANLEDMNPNFPALSDDLAFPDEPLWMFPTDTPTPEEIPPVGSYSAMMGYSPFPPDQAAEAAEKQGTVNCRTLQVNMRNPGTTLSTFATANAAPYTLEINGSGQIGSNVWNYHVNFLQTNAPDIFSAQAGTWTGGVGWDATDVNFGVDIRSVLLDMVLPAGTYTRISFTYNLTKGTYSSPQPAVIIFLNGGIVASIASNVAADGTGLVLNWTGSEVNPSNSGIQVLSSYGGFSGSCRITSITFGGTGTNPFDGTPASDEQGDAYYRFFPDDDGSAVLFEPTEGLLLNTVKPAIIPPYDPSHSYKIPYVGDGNPIAASYSLVDYTGTQNRNITIKACRDA